MKYLTALILVLCISACGEQVQAPKAKTHEDIFVLIENGGTIASRISREGRGDYLQPRLPPGRQ